MRIKGGFGWDHRSSDHRNLNGIYTDGLGSLRLEILEEIFRINFIQVSQLRELIEVKERFR